MNHVECMIAFRYLRARRADGFVSLITGLSFVGIVLGVATLIIVMAVMNGFRIELVQRILGVNGHAVITAVGRDLPEYPALLEAVRGVPGVVSASPTVETQLMISHGNRARGIVLRGHTPEALAALTPVSHNVRAGSLQALQAGNALALGARLADILGVRVGDTVTLLSPRGTVTPFGTAPRIRPYRVGAVFDMGMSLYDETFVFTDLRAASELLNRPPTALNVFVKNPDRVGEIMPALNAALGDDYQALTWQEANDTFFAALAVERNVMFLILSLIILVAALNIVSGMTMLVKDKTADIAVLRTIGAGRGAILRVFTLAGAAIGIAGTVVGTAAGLLFCHYIEPIRQGLSRALGVSLFDPKVYFLARMPAEVLSSDVVFTASMALSLSIVAALYPAFRAARLQPAEALRYG